MTEHGTYQITESVQGTVPEECNHFYDTALNVLNRFCPERNITIRARDPAGGCHGDLRGGTHIEKDEEERSARAGTHFGMRDERIGAL